MSYTNLLFIHLSLITYAKVSYSASLSYSHRDVLCVPGTVLVLAPPSTKMNKVYLLPQEVYSLVGKQTYEYPTTVYM